MAGHAPSPPPARRVSVVTFEDFLREQLPPPPARVLEVGAGAGELTTALSVTGYDVLGIDPAAPPGELFRRLLLEDLDDPGPFDAVVAQLSAHLLRDLDAALERVVALLAQDGVLAVELLAWERMDGRTAGWLLERRRALAADSGDGDVPADADALRAEWASDHLGLHPAAVVEAALAARFVERARVPAAGLYREAGGREAQVLEDALISAGTLEPLGVFWAGVPRDG